MYRRPSVPSGARLTALTSRLPEWPHVRSSTPARAAQQLPCQGVQLSACLQALPLTGFSLPDAVSVRMLTVLALDDDFPGRWRVSVQPIAIDV